MTQFTFALIKSKAIRHNLHPLVLSRIIENDFIIERAQWGVMPVFLIEQFYKDHIDKPYWYDLAKSVAGHTISLILSRENAVHEWRALMGATDPRKAAAGTLRALAIGEPAIADNIVHGSDSAENAEREIRLLFGADMWFHILTRSKMDADRRSKDGT